VGRQVGEDGGEDEDDTTHRRRPLFVMVALDLFLDELADAVVTEHADRSRHDNV
jgi:hypothetical protein